MAPATTTSKSPGPLAPGSYSYQVKSIDKYGDVSSPSATQTITVVPPLVTVMSVTDKTNKKHQVTQVTVVFSGSVNSTEAQMPTGIYRLATPGKKGSYTAKNAGDDHASSRPHIRRFESYCRCSSPRSRSR